MNKLPYQELLLPQEVDGTALTNTTTATSLLPQSAKYALQKNYLCSGKSFRIRAGGRISTAGSSPGTLTLDFRLGGTVVFDGGASPTLAVSASNLTWALELILSARAIGASTINLFGYGFLFTAALSAATPIMLLPASSPTTGNNVDPSAELVADLFAKWSVASASNSIRCDSYHLEALN